MKYRLMVCGVCDGSGRHYSYDGVGGRWEQRCTQCKGKGKVKVT